MDALLTIARDAAWGAIGAIVAVVAIVVAWQLTPKAKVKRLQFERYLDVLVGLEDNLNGRLQLSYDGKPKTNIWSVKYQFSNTGTEAISAGDFERPIAFSLAGEGTGELLRASIEVQYPQQLKLDVTATGRSAVIAPAMLNPGDRFAVTLLLADKCQLAMDYRIAGVSKIEDATSKPQDHMRAIVLWRVRGAVTLAVLVVAASIGVWAFEFARSLAGVATR